MSDNDAKNMVKKIDNLPERCRVLILQILTPDEPYNKLFFKGFTQNYLLRKKIDYSECNSPIEVLFYFAYEIMECTYVDEFRDIIIQPQYEIQTGKKKYYADFFISIFGFNGYKNKLVVECDGYDYHSSKEQIKHDNERDYHIKSEGYDIIHFSGTEIYDNPFICVKKAIKLILKNKENIENIREVKTVGRKRKCKE